MSSSTKIVDNSQITSEEWDTLRYHFQDSVMAKTNLCKLAKDMGEKWPIRGKDETPEKYIGFTLDALGELPEIYGKGNRLALLCSILKETLSLDEPYSEMASHFEEEAKKEDSVMLALRQLEIPTGFPVRLANFSTETQKFCRVENIRTIFQFIDFARKSAKSVVIKGDYQIFLNALIQKDVETLKKFLPIRPGEVGLYLAESIGLLASSLTDRQAASLLQLYEFSTTKPAWAPENALSKAETTTVVSVVKQAVLERLDMMPDQAQQLRHALDSGEASSVRFFISLRDAETESLALAIAKAALDKKPPSRGFISRILK